MNVPQTAASIADLLKDTITDAQALVRGEVALAKAELRTEVKRLGAGVVALAGAAVLALIAVIFLLAAAALAIPAAAGWPAWSGFALVGGVVLVAAVLAGVIGRRRVTSERYMPLTLETMKENLEWTRAQRS
jgi:hypothetical protein